MQIRIIFHLEKNLSAQVLVTVSLFLREFGAHGASYGRSNKELPLGHSASYHFWKDIGYPLLRKAALKAQRKNRWWPSLCLCSRSFLHPQWCVINITMGKYRKCQGCYGLSLFVKPSHPCWAPNVQRPLPCSPSVAQILLSSSLPPTSS